MGTELQLRRFQFGGLRLVALIAVIAVANLFASAQSPRRPRQQTPQAEPKRQTVQEPATPAIDPLLQEADAALNKKDYATAASALEKYLAKNPSDYRAEFNLAYAYSLSDRGAEAIAHYQNVIKNQPELVPARLNAGILQLEAGSAEAAAANLRAVVDKDPENVTALSYLAQALAALKRTAEAAEAYERVLQKRPEDARAHLGYARLLESSDRIKAEEHLRRAVAIDPSLDEASLRLAALLEERASGSPDALREPAGIYQRYLEKHPERMDLRIRLGEIYFTQKQFPEAIAEFEKVRAGGDSSLPVARDLLTAYLKQSESAGTAAAELKEKALPLVQEILAREPRNPEMHLLYGSLRMGKKQYPEAALEFREATKLAPDSSEGYKNLASAFYLMENYQATIEALERIAELKADNAGTYFLRAICLDKLHIRRAALENYQSFLKSDGGKNPDQDFQARTRSRILELEIQKGMGGRK